MGRRLSQLDHSRLWSRIGRDVGCSDERESTGDEDRSDLRAEFGVRGSSR
jgi:hypothetical protein